MVAQQQHQHQAINDNLLDELAITTKILNQTLSEKNTLQGVAQDLQQKINILEQQLETYQQENADLTGDIPCNMISSIFDILVQVLLLEKDTKICQIITDLKKPQIPTTTTTIPSPRTTIPSPRTTIPSPRTTTNTATLSPTTAEKNPLD